MTMEHGSGIVPPVLQTSTQKGQHRSQTATTSIRYNFDSGRSEPHAAQFNPKRNTNTSLLGDGIDRARSHGHAERNRYSTKKVLDVMAQLGMWSFNFHDKEKLLMRLHGARRKELAACEKELIACFCFDDRDNTGKITTLALSQIWESVLMHSLARPVAH